MSVVEPVTNTFSTPSSAELNTSEGLKDSFLTMLMAQLQYQDTLDPMENTEFTAQLAQINTVEQLQQVNRNLGYQQLYMASINNSQALDFIGKEIVAPVDPRHELRHHARVAPDETLHGVAVLAVPLGPHPARECSPELVRAHGIPGLGD